MKKIISKEAINYSKLPKTVKMSDFNTLFNLRPENTNKVTIFNKETQQFEEKVIFRNYMCYLNTPEFKPEFKKSYMFEHKSDSIPQELLPFLEYAKSLNPNYNQMVVNWYNPEDYIEMHRDCNNSFIDKNAEILMINLNESSDLKKCRSLDFKDVNTGETTSVPLVDKTAYIIDNNNTHRHGVGKGTEKRISITFRMVK